MKRRPFPIVIVGSFLLAVGAWMFRAQEQAKQAEAAAQLAPHQPTYRPRMVKTARLYRVRRQVKGKTTWVKVPAYLATGFSSYEWNGLYTPDGWQLGGVRFKKDPEHKLYQTPNGWWCLGADYSLHLAEDVAYGSPLPNSITPPESGWHPGGASQAPPS